MQDAFPQLLNHRTSIPWKGYLAVTFRLAHRPNLPSTNYIPGTYPVHGDLLTVVGGCMSVDEEKMHGIDH